MRKVFKFKYFDALSFVSHSYIRAATKYMKLNGLRVLIVLDEFPSFFAPLGTIPHSLWLRPEGSAEEPAPGGPDKEIWQPEEWCE